MTALSRRFSALLHGSSPFPVRKSVSEHCHGWPASLLCGAMSTRWWQCVLDMCWWSHALFNGGYS